MRRYLFAAGLSTLVATGLFWVMNFMILGGSTEMQESDSYQPMDFVRLQPDEQLQLRERSRPEPPPPPDEPPPPPQLQVQQSVQNQQQSAPTPFDMPKLNLSNNLVGGPILGDLASATSAGGSAELIPLVRLTPQYPRQAARAKISGWVRLRITVNPDGSVRDARVVASEPRGMFEEAAVVAARRGKFRPRIDNGVAVESSGEYTVNFRASEE
jgi:periplasmic protein TonB